MIPSIRSTAGVRAESDRGEVKDGGVINTCAQGNSGSAHASANNAHASGVGSVINTEAISAGRYLPATAFNAQLHNRFVPSVSTALLGAMCANAVGGVASSGGQSTTTAIAAHTINVHHHYASVDGKEEKCVVAPLSESHDALITRLKSHYGRKRNLPGLLSEHEQPIADINLSITDTASATTQTQEEKRSTTLKREEAALAHFEKMHVVNHPVPVLEIFDRKSGKEHQLESKPTKHLLVTGAAGVGKTTMSQYVAYQWSIGKLWAHKFDYLFWIPLRNLLQYPVDVKSEISLAHVIHTECFNTHRIISVPTIEEVLTRQANRTLLVLDGYDEIAHLLEDRHHPIARVLREACESEYCMLTSRPHQLPPSDVFQIDRRLENTGFTDSNIKSYVTRYFRGFTPSQTNTGQALLIFLKTNLSVWGTAHIPINLALICEIWQTSRFAADAAEGKEEAKSSKYLTSNVDLSITGLYQEMSLFLLKRYLEKNGIKTRAELPGFVYEKCQLEMEFLSELAFEGLQRRQIIITKELQHDMLKKFQSKLRPDVRPFFDKVLAAGFLRAAESSLKEELDKPHYFIHLTFQEYLAACYLVNCLKKASDSEKFLKVTEWLRTEKYNPRYQMVLGFMAGLLSLNTDTNAALQQFWQVLLTEPFDLTGIGHIQLIIRCLEESRDARRIPYHLKLLNEVGQWISASANANKSILGWVSTHLRSNPWVLKQPNMLRNVLATIGDQKQLLVILRELRAEDVLAIPGIFSVLLTALRDEDHWVRSDAAELLGGLEPTAFPEAIVQGLQAALCDNSEWVRWNVVNVLGKLNPAAVRLELIKALQTTLCDDSSMVRDSAAYALNRLLSADAKSELLKELQALLRDTDAMVRSKAAEALGRLGTAIESPDIITSLVAALRDESEYVRSGAVEALGRLVPVPPTFELLKELQELLHDEDYDRVRKRTTWTLGRLGVAAATPEVIQTLQVALRYGDTKVAAEALSQIGPAAATYEVLTTLQTKIGETERLWDMEIRQVLSEALDRLSAVAKPQVLIQLQAALRDENPSVRKIAALTLGRLGAAVPMAQILQALQDASRDKDESVRSNAVFALGRLGPVAVTHDVLVAFQAALHDENVCVRLNAARALGRLGPTAATDETLQALRAMLRDEKEVRMGAVESLRLLGAAGNPELISDLLLALRDENVNTRINAIEIIERLGPAAATPEIMKALQAALSDPVVEVRSNAAETLGRLGSAAATQGILKSLQLALHDKNDKVRCMVAFALGQLGPIAATHEILRLLQLALLDECLAVRSSAAQSLGRLGVFVKNAEIMQALQKACYEPHEFVRGSAVEAIGQLGPVVVTPGLQRTLCDEDEWVRKAAVRALERVDYSNLTTEHMSFLLNVFCAKRYSDVTSCFSKIFNTLAISHGLYHLNIELLESAFKEGIYFSATPLSAFINTWLRFRTESMCAPNETQMATCSRWLKLVATLAFYRTTPVTLSTEGIGVQENNAAIMIPLQGKYAGLLRDEFVEAFAREPRGLGIQNELYTTLRNRSLPYPFEPVLRAPIHPVSARVTKDCIQKIAAQSETKLTALKPFGFKAVLTVGLSTFGFFATGGVGGVVGAALGIGTSAVIKGAERCCRSRSK